MNNPIRSRPHLVRDLMSKTPITITEDDSLLMARDLFAWKAIRHLPVTSADGVLVGLLTQRDLLTVSVSKLAHLPPAEQDELYSSIKVGDVMGRKVKVAHPQTPLDQAAEIMLTNRFGCLPVVSGQHLVGIVTTTDFLKAFAISEMRGEEKTLSA